MEDGRTTIDQAKRAEIYKKAQQLMYDECPVIPIAHSTVVWPASKKMVNFKLHPTGSVMLRSVWLE
jgi:peptide/nickel transport system substrate-binding protein